MRDPERIPRYVHKYPKTQSLWKRDMEAVGPGKGLIVPGEFVMEEFQSVKYWHVTEKIHGQNIRVACRAQHFDNAPSEYTVEFFGRRGGEDNIQKDLLKRLKDYFTPALFRMAFRLDEREEGDFEQLVVLYGEGYGDKIQSWHYGLEGEQSFTLFDVVVNDIWLTQDSVTEVAKEIGVERVPVLHHSMELKNAVLLLCDMESMESRLQPGHPCEGIVCRSQPLMLHRYHKTPIMWKLKVSDYRKLFEFRDTGKVTEGDWGT